jgi:uncharacterized protein
MDSAKVTYYQDDANEWRWRVQATNGQILADSGEGYKNKGDCVNGFHRLCDLVGGNPAIIEVEFADDE